MSTPARCPRPWRFLAQPAVRGLALAALSALAGLAGCSTTEKPTTAPAPYVDKGYKPGIPDFMKGTVYERTDVSNTDPYLISGYSIVVNLLNTGDNSSLPKTVRDAIVKRLALEGFGSRNNAAFANLQPEDVLRDKRVAVVQVKGYLPVGARRGQMFDVVVQAMPRSATSSLAHGHLYQTELRDRGLEQPGVGGMIFAYADDGDVFVNPEYALSTGIATPKVKASLRTGIVLGRGRVTEDRPIFLQLRVPQASIARSIEGRVINRFQDEQDRPAAAAQDEGIVALYVPVSFGGGWQHFLAVVNHLYLNDSPEFVAQKARQLVAEAHKPGAALTDISYCWEAMGAVALPVYQPLVKDADPGVSYAAARAAVFGGDPGAVEALTLMAGDRNHPFQLAAVHTLGELPPSPAVDKQLEPLLASDQTLVRLEAYKILAAHGDRLIVSRPVPDDRHPRFWLDVVDCGGPPLVYATRSGEKRLAVFGHATSLTPPVMYSALDSRLTISSDDMGRRLTMYYRDPGSPDPVRLDSGTELPEVVARLGGVGPEGEPAIRFSYGDVVAVVQALAESHRVTGFDTTGEASAAPFVLEQPAELADALSGVPSVDSRPQGEAARAAGARPPTPGVPPGPGIPAADGATPVPDFGGRPGGAMVSPGGAGPSQSSGSNAVPAF